MKKLFDFIKRMYKKFESLIKFCVVGLLNTIVTYIVFTVLVLLGMPGTCERELSEGFWLYVLAFIVNANTIGDIAGGINSYFWNSRWVFKNKSFQSIPKFILTFIVYMVISAVLMWLAVEIMGMNELVAKIIVIPITTICNYLMSKLFAFRRKKEE